MAVWRTASPSDHFTQVPNAWLRDSRLSLKAKGLLAYLMSHNANFKLSTAQIVAASTDGRDAVKAGLQELEACGYITRVRSHEQDGKFAGIDYILSCEDCGIPTIDGLTGDGSATDGKSAPKKNRSLEDQVKETPLPPKGGESEFELIEPVAAPKAGRRQPKADYTEQFEWWWSLYPKKVGKKPAAEKYHLAAEKVGHEMLVRALEFQLTYLRSRGQYAPEPATWLHQERWTDDPYTGLTSEQRDLAEGWR